MHIHLPSFCLGERQGYQGFIPMCFPTSPSPGDSLRATSGKMHFWTILGTNLHKLFFVFMAKEHAVEEKHCV
jgi:hypothetical protein